MKKKIRLIVSGIIILFAVFCYAHIAKQNYIYDRAIDASDYKATTFYTDEVIIQQFKSVENSLDGINVKCKLSGDTDDIKVKYSLVESESGNEVAKGEALGKDFQNSKFFEFEFDTVSNCKGKEYEFVLEETGNTAENYIEFCFIDKREADTKLSFGKEDINGTLVMKTVTNRFDFETFFMLLIFVLYVIVFMKCLYRLFR